MSHSLCHRPGSLFPPDKGRGLEAEVSQTHAHSRQILPSAAGSADEDERFRHELEYLHDGHPEPDKEQNQQAWFLWRPGD